MYIGPTMQAPTPHMEAVPSSNDPSPSAAWARAMHRPGAIIGLSWLVVVLFFALFAPVLASDRPLIYRELDAVGSPGRASFPLFERLSAVDLVLLAAGLFGPIVLFSPGRTTRPARLGMILAAGAQAAVTLAMISGTRHAAAPEHWLPGPTIAVARVTYGIVVGLGVGVLFLAVPSTRRAASRVALVGVTALIAGGAGGFAWSPGLRETRWAEETTAGRARAVFTLIPHSPERGATERGFLPPGSTGAEVAVPGVLRVLGGLGTPGDQPADARVSPEILDAIEPAISASGLDGGATQRLMDALRARQASGALPDGHAVIRTIRSGTGPRFLLGTDGFGRDVLSQVLHACRLSISIGLVSTGIAVLIGITIGAIMGYCGGVIDLVLSRVVEVFMSVPLLFLLVVAAGVLPFELRGTYPMMAIIGCFTWTGAARFTRAEFLRLRGQDFVHSARAQGLPLRSILFRHMLPNGVTPVLVEASFAVAAAITIEATLSFLGLGPVDQPSWGRLLAGAYDYSGVFRWWLVAVPGGAIFLTVLSYNLIGEALRDALDPRFSSGAPHR